MTLQDRQGLGDLKKIIIKQGEGVRVKGTNAGEFFFLSRSVCISEEFRQELFSLLRSFKRGLFYLHSLPIGLLE